MTADQSRTPAVFIDKDGTLVEDVPYNVDPDLIRLTSGALRGLARLQARGYRLVLVSNQSGVARGLFAEHALESVWARLDSLLDEGGVRLDGVYYCPHHPDGAVPDLAKACDCRKPAAGLITRAAREMDLDLARSWMVGDILDDVEAGRRAGLRTVLLDRGGETEWSLSSDRLPHHIAPDLDAAARLIIAADEPGSAVPRAGAGRFRPTNTEEPFHMDAILDRLEGRRIVVLGEAMLDRTVDGVARRLCAEGPVPVVSEIARHDRAGGAANTALNLAALGAHTDFATLAGADASGRVLRRILDEAGVRLDAMIEDRNRATILKTRIFADGRLLLRLDEGDTRPPDPQIAHEMLAGMEGPLAEADAVVVSDYAYGAVFPAVLERLQAWRRDTGRPLVVDARDLTRFGALRPTAVVPNYAEAMALLGVTGKFGGERVPHAAEHADRLLALSGAEFAVVTLDSDGAIVLRPEDPPLHFPAHTARAVDPVGAGDTFAAALAVALAAGARPEAATRIASKAAGVAVSKAGTATCTIEDLRGAGEGARIVASVARLGQLVDGHRQRGRRIVFTNGCFDILHRGHLEYLQEARRQGDVLIVGVNDDASVRRLKGAQRPLNVCADRLAILASLDCVDHVIAFGEDTPEALIRALRPDVFVKGGDYTRADLREAPVVEALGGEVRLLRFRDGHSTTSLIERIRSFAPFTDAAE